MLIFGRQFAAPASGLSPYEQSDYDFAPVFGEWDVVDVFVPQRNDALGTRLARPGWANLDRRVLILNDVEGQRDSRGIPTWWVGEREAQSLFVISEFRLNPDLIRAVGADALRVTQQLIESVCSASNVRAFRVLVGLGYADLVLFAFSRQCYDNLHNVVLKLRQKSVGCLTQLPARVEVSVPQDIPVFASSFSSWGFFPKTLSADGMRAWANQLPSSGANKHWTQIFVACIPGQEARLEGFFERELNKGSVRQLTSGIFDYSIECPIDKRSNLRSVLHWTFDVVANLCGPLEGLRGVARLTRTVWKTGTAASSVTTLKPLTAGLVHPVAFDETRFRSTLDPARFHALSELVRVINVTLQFPTVNAYMRDVVKFIQAFLNDLAGEHESTGSAAERRPSTAFVGRCVEEVVLRLHRVIAARSYAATHALRPEPALHPSSAVHKIAVAASAICVELLHLAPRTRAQSPMPLFTVGAIASPRCTAIPFGRGFLLHEFPASMLLEGDLFECTHEVFHSFATVMRDYGTVHKMVSLKDTSFWLMQGVARGFNTNEPGELHTGGFLETADRRFVSWDIEDEELLALTQSLADHLLGDFDRWEHRVNSGAELARTLVKVLGAPKGGTIHIADWELISELAYRVRNRLQELPGFVDEVEADVLAAVVCGRTAYTEHLGRDPSTSTRASVLGEAFRKNTSATSPLVTHLRGVAATASRKLSGATRVAEMRKTLQVGESLDDRTVAYYLQWWGEFMKDGVC